MIILSEGGKGGVGKSLMTSILVNNLLEKREDFVLIETDTSNPDCYKSHNQFCNCELQKIDSKNDWANFLTLLDANKEKEIIVNMPARNQASIYQWGDTIKEISEDILVFFLLNTQRDSAILLKEYAKIIEPARIIPTKNLYFGELNEFTLYDESATKKLFSREFFIEPMMESASEQLYNERKCLAEIANTLNVGDRIFYKRWLADTHERLNTLLTEVNNEV